jgi:signal transduction histidine kinase
VVRHAEARHVTVNLSYLGTQTKLTVSDDGKGVDLAALAGDGHHGQGIPNMQARARLLEGDLRLESEPGRGFALAVTVPCRGNGAQAEDSPCA